MANRSLDGGYIDAAQAEKGSFLKDTNAPWQKLEKGQKYINICYLASFLHFMGQLKLPKMPIKKVHHSPQLLLFLTSFFWLLLVLQNSYHFTFVVQAEL